MDNFTVGEWVRIAPSAGGGIAIVESFDKNDVIVSRGQDAPKIPFSSRNVGAAVKATLRVPIEKVWKM